MSAAIIQPNCATTSCHSRGAAVSGLDFSTASRGFTSLTGLWIWIVDPTMATAEGCRSVDGTVVCQREHRSFRHGLPLFGCPGRHRAAHTYRPR